MRIDTKKRKNAMVGFRQMTGDEMARQSLHRIIIRGKSALDGVFLDIGRMLAESIMLMEREELAGPDYQPTNPRLQKWAHEEGSIYIGDQKVKVNRPRLRDSETGEVDLQSYKKMREHGHFSEEILEKVLCGVSAQKYEETVLGAASSFGVSSSSVSKKMVEITAGKLREFQTRSLTDFRPFALFLDTIHRGGEAFLVALGIDIKGEKMALGFWQGSSENHALCEELFQDLERRGLVLSKQLIFVTDGGSGLIKALRDRFGKKLLHQRCAIHKSRNLQKHLAKKYRKEAHRLLKNIKRSRGSSMLQRWLGSVLLYCEKQFNRVQGYQEIEQVIASIDNEFAAQVQKAGMVA